MCYTTFEKKTASTNALHLRLVEVATQSEADANKARTDLQDLQPRLVEAALEPKLASGDLDKAQNSPPDRSMPEKKTVTSTDEDAKSSSSP